MAPQTDSPRIKDLTPEAVAAEACQLILDHLGRQLFALGPALTGAELGRLDATQAASGTDLGLTVQDLVRFAQDGDTADWGDYLGATDALQSVCERLYSQAGVPGTFELGEIAGTADPETPIGVVLVAATARIAIEQGEDVTTRQLAVLGGVTSEHLSRLGQKGEIDRAGRGTYSAESARRWLEARGVGGWTK